MTANGGSLYLINADGSDLRHLADGIIDPVVSPDGRQVAFTRWDGAELGQVYTLSLDDGSEHPIFPDAIRQPKSPAWSPNGRQMIISFQSGGLRDPEEICHEYDADDGFHPPENIAKVTKSRFSDGVWVFCYLPMEDLRWRLRWINIETGSFEDLPAADYSFTPAWDPYLPWRIIYDSTKGLMQFDVTTGQQWAITTDLRDKVPVFSPDGQKLALTYKQHDHWEVYTLDLATGERHRLTKPPILADPQYNSAAPAWSPDGRQIAFVTDRTGVWELWVMNSDGSDQHPLFPAETQAQFSLRYDGVNERMLNWIDGE
jgi:Tol biopolymer transport system component